jgi:hypothetical protein
MSVLNVDMFTAPYSLTKTYHRDIYPAVDPTNPELSASGKVIVVTGAAGGVGFVRPFSLIPFETFRQPSVSKAKKFFALGHCQSMEYCRRQRNRSSWAQQGDFGADS